jgi:hypothetical protein
VFAFAASVAIPVWLAPVLVGVTAIGAIANAVGGIIGDFISLRRLQSLDAQRTQREIAQHAELMAAVKTKETP